MSRSPKLEKNEEAMEELRKDLCVAAMDGNIEILDDWRASDCQIFRKSCEDNNIIHIAVRYEKKDFVEAFLKRYLDTNQKIIREKNSGGNTALHVAAEVGNLGIVELLYDCLNKKKIIDDDDDDEEEKPWRTQNCKGNTAMHVALIYDNCNVAKFLLDQDPGVARVVNESKEAPLHLAITHCTVDYESFEHGPSYAALHEYITNMLLEKARCVASWRDGKGLTPLHRAASLNAPYNLQITKQIIEKCPESTLVCDASGNSILHLLTNKIFGNEEIKDLFRLREINILTNQQDENGNTPLHIAEIRKNICMVKVLMDSGAKRHIKNRYGKSALSTIQQQDLFQPLQQRLMTREESSSVYKRDLSFLSNRMHTFGINFLASQDSKGKNVLHILMAITEDQSYDREEFSKFIKEALDICPQLICQTDQTGNTPVHVLVQNKDSASKSRFLSHLLLICSCSIKKFENEVFHNGNEAHYHLPWLVQNASGNSPLHEAIVAKNKVLMLQLLHYSKEPARLVNKSSETPLHLLAKADAKGMKEFKVRDIMELVMANVEALESRDNDSLTPVSRALKAENLNMVVTLLVYVQKFSDAEGQTFWHHVLRHESDDFVNGLLRDKKFRKMLEQKDKHGNTPLHLAMKKRCFGFVEKILETYGRKQELSEVESNQWLLDLIRTPDNDGLTPIIRALKANNLCLGTKLCRVSPEATKIGDSDGKTFWHLLLKHPSYNPVDVNDLLKIEALRKVLEQKDKDGNTPLHLAIKEKRFDFVQDLLNTLGSEHESNQWLMDLLTILDNDCLTPIIRAFKADNLDLATRLCHLTPEAALMGDTDGTTVWHLLLKHPSYCPVKEKVNDLLQFEALLTILEQKDKDGNTPLHIAIKEKHFDFVQALLEKWGSALESSTDNQWPMDLLKIPNNVGETPEDLLADLPTLSDTLEKKLLTDRRMRGIRSSWGIPRTQLQNYMSSMNVIAALQTTITFTAAFTVPGGLFQDIGTPILIRSIAFQAFMISDVIAMCLSMMVLICLLWMVATNKRESVLIQDFALWLLLASFVATLLTFITGVYATISPVKPWIAIFTLVLCSFLMLLFPRYMLTKLLLHFKYRKNRCVKIKCLQHNDGSNTQDTKLCFGRLNCFVDTSSNSAS